MGEIEGIPNAFREHLARHNRQVVFLVLFTLLTAVVLWGGAYFFIYWIVLFGETALKGVDARMPPGFVLALGILGVELCLLGWIAQKLWPNYFPKDKKSPFEIVMDFVLAAPRVTLAIWGNLSAFQAPSEVELEEAWHLLRAVGHDRKMRVQSVPLEIPDPKLRAKVVLMLQLVGLIELRKYDGDYWLVTSSDKARRLSQTTFRIETKRKE